MDDNDDDDDDNDDGLCERGAVLLSADTDVAFSPSAVVSVWISDLAVVTCSRTLNITDWH